MNQSRVAVRYAKAVLELASEQGAAEAVDKDMRLIAREISENRELRDMLANPVLKGSEKKAALFKAFKGVHAHTEGLISLLVDNKRIAILNEVALKYRILFQDLKGREVAYITTAVPMTEAIEKKALAKVATITDKKLTLENNINPDILGGFVLRVGDLQYDASVATKLGNLKRVLTDA